MEFFNIGGGELLVIVLLALILFGPEDIVKMMRTMGRYARQARGMWSQFNETLQSEYLDSDELSEAIQETKATIGEAQEAIQALNTSVGEVASAVEKDVAEAQQTVRQQGDEAAHALKDQLKPGPVADQVTTGTAGVGPEDGLPEPTTEPTSTTTTHEEA
jgi:sec-independent protein translocase protein TatB